MQPNQIILGGAAYNVAPLKSLQVAAFFDALEDAKSGETKVQTFTRTLRVIAQSLKNAGSPLVGNLATEDAVIEAIDNISAFPEINPAFAKVIEISGLKAATPGEAPAAESTSNESTAALSAS